MSGRLNIPNSEYIDPECANLFCDKLNYKSHFNLLRINCRSIYNKIDEVKSLATLVKANVIAVTEDEIAQITALEDFNFEHKPRSNNTRGGGVGFFIDKTLAYERIDVKNTNISTFEFILIKLTVDIKNKI